MLLQYIQTLVRGRKGVLKLIKVFKRGEGTVVRAFTTSGGTSKVISLAGRRRLRCTAPQNGTAASANSPTARQWAVERCAPLRLQSCCCWSRVHQLLPHRTCLSSTAAAAPLHRSQVVIPDVRAGKAVVHVVNRVLVPGNKVRWPRAKVIR